MADLKDPRYCLVCGDRQVVEASVCSNCGSDHLSDPLPRLAGVAFMVSELTSMARRGVISFGQYQRLSARHLRELREAAGLAPASSLVQEAEALRQVRPPVEAYARSRISVATPARPQRSTFERFGAGWLPDQQANILLCLGAFLVVIATVIFVSSSRTLGAEGNIAAMVAGTLAFGVAGAICRRVEKVQQAGAVFLAVCAILVPLDFLGAYVFFFEEQGISPTGLWLAGSLACSGLYLALSFLNIGRWYPVPSGLAMISSLRAASALLDLPAEIAGPAYIVLAMLLTLPELYARDRVREVLGSIWWRIGHLLVAAVLLYTVFVLTYEAGTERYSFGLSVALSCCFFYYVIAWLRPGSWQAWTAVLAVSMLPFLLLRTLAAPDQLVVISYGGLALLLGWVPWAPIRWLGVVARPSLLTACIVAPASAMAAVALAVDSVDMLRGFLPATLVLAASFYALQALLVSSRLTLFDASLPGSSFFRSEPWVPGTAWFCSLTLAGAAAVSLVYALELREELYAPVAQVVAVVYALALLPSRWRWPGRAGLGSLSLIATGLATLTASWIGPESYAAAITLTSAALCIGLARKLPSDADVLRPLQSLLEGDGLTWQQAGSLLSVLLVYAAAVLIAAGYFFALTAYTDVDLSRQSELALSYFGLSLALTATAASTRLWWPLVTRHVYVIALTMSAAVLLITIQFEPQLLAMLTTYTIVSLAVVTLVERSPSGLFISAVYGFLALLAARQHFEIDDALLPRLIASLAAGLFLLHWLLSTRQSAWSSQLRTVAFAYAVAAPIWGWYQLAMLADAQGYVGSEHLTETLLYQTSILALVALGLLVGLQSRLSRNLPLGIGASVLLLAALLLEIRSFNPSNLQAYSVPVGLYFLAGTLLLSRYARLPSEMAPWVERLYGLGPTIIMAPSFVQSLGTSDETYSVILLVEALLFLAFAVVERRVWLLTIAVSFVVLNALNYLLFSTETRTETRLPSWAILALVGLVVMLSGTAILLGRERWSEIQRRLIDWWERRPDEFGLPNGN
jgi:hypothetical protein